MTVIETVVPIIQSTVYLELSRRGAWSFAF